MKRIISVLVVILSFSFLSHAQTEYDWGTGQWGSSFEALKKRPIRNIIKSVDQEFFAICQRNYTGIYFGPVFIEKFDPQLNSIFREEIELEYKEKKRLFEFILPIDDQFHLFTSFGNQKLKRNFLFSEKLNKKSLAPDNELKMIAEIDYEGYGRYNDGDYNFETSRDSSKILIYYKLPYDKGGQERFGFHVLDRSLSELWHQDILLPYEDKLFKVQDYEIDNMGVVHLLGKKYNGKDKEIRNKQANYAYEILSFNGKDQTKYRVESSTKFLRQMQISVDEELNLICAGFYSDIGVKSIGGSYFMRIDSRLKTIITEDYQDFDIDFLALDTKGNEEARMEKKDAQGKDVELNKFKLSGIIVRDDGGAVLIGEQSYTKAKGNQRSTSIHYYLNDIIVVSIGPDGIIDWSRKIAKRQHTADDAAVYSSYALCVHDDKLRFIYNDDVENLNYNGDGRLKNFKNKSDALIMLATIDSQGNQTREPLFGVNKTGVFIRPSSCKQLSPDQFILATENKKDSKLVSLVFK